MDRTPISRPTAPIPTTKGYPAMLHGSDIRPRTMRWLWHPYIPLGTTTMLFGPGGIGKSHIVCDLAAAITTGRPLPGQNPDKRREPRKVLMLSAEDDLQVVLQPRLVRAGADLENVYMPNGAFTLDAAGILHLEGWMKEYACTVAFVDPVVAYVGGKIDMNKMNEVRTFTGALTQAAMRTNTAIILVHHSRKGKDGADFEKAAGSADFINAVRSTLYTNKTDDGIKFMRHVKSNYAREGMILTYEFDQSDNFRWTGSIGDDLLVSAGNTTSKARPRAKAGKFIQDTLANGPVPAAAIIELAEKEGFNLKTLQRAKEGIAESYMVREPGTDGVERNVWYWRLI